MEQQNENVNYNELFIIKEDEFSGTKYVALRHGMSGNIELDQFCDEIDASKPEINVSVIIKPENNVPSISLVFITPNLLKMIRSEINDAKEWEEEHPGSGIAAIPSLKANNKLNLYYKKWAHIDSPARGIIIVVDGTESIKLDADGDTNPNISYFPINKDIFLKLCNANDLKFRIFKEASSDAIVIHGTKKEEANLITKLQGLYNFVIDKNMFPDAVRRLKQLSEMKRKMALENSKGNRDLAIGIPLGVIGGPISILIASIEDDSNGTCYTFLITIPLLFIGIMLIIFGAWRKSGKMIKRY